MEISEKIADFLGFEVMQKAGGHEGESGFPK